MINLVRYMICLIAYLLRVEGYINDKTMFKSITLKSISISSIASLATTAVLCMPVALAEDPVMEKKADTGVIEKAEMKSEWIQLFNGKDLTGWTPKFKGSELGVNHKNVFKVKDGVLVVDYSEYGDWDKKFGHLFYEKEFSHYILRAEYRFVGEQSNKGPGWAKRNNGFMIHGQTAKSMKLNQEFPNSIEVQLLGGPAEGERGNLNICEVIRHKQDGKTVIEYSKPQLNDGTLLKGGTISIQSESHHTEFRKIEIKEIKK